MVHHLELRVERVRLRILVDGEDRLAHLYDGSELDPDRLLGADSALIPGASPHDVVLLSCSCGETGCGALLATVRRDGDEVVWDNFRDGSWDEFPEESEFPVGGRPIDAPEIRFSSSQYLGELDRADRDRSWEWPDRTCARLVREAMKPHRERLLAESGWKFEWTTKGTPSFERRDAPDVGRGVSAVLSHVATKRWATLGFFGATEDPARRATEILSVILGDRDAWPIIDRLGARDAWSHHPDP